MDEVWPRIVIDESIPPDTFELRDPITGETLLIVDIREGCDPRSDLCWRCDTRVADDDLGLCESCRQELE